MRYWLDLFTGTTWDEFRGSGASVAGFTNRMRRTVQAIQAGDILICYLNGMKRWIGALEATGPSTETKRLWKDAEFPARLAVKPMVMLSPETGVPMEQLFLQKTAQYFTAVNDL